MADNNQSSSGGLTISASATREDILKALQREGISDLNSYVALCLDKAKQKLQQGMDDNAPGSASADLFIHEHYVVWHNEETLEA